MNVKKLNIPKEHPQILEQKVGVIIGNLGTPDATDYWSMRRYLREFLSDRRVIDYSPWVWKPILNLILLRRPFSSGEAYKEIWNNEENESPLLTITKAQAKKLRARFDRAYGDKVLVENASVGVGWTASGFKSSGYDYARFEITEVTPNFGGIGTVKYDMSNYLSQNVDYPGVFDAVNSVATLIPDKWFPQFDVQLQPNVFRVGDEVESFDSTGTQIKGVVFDWNNSSKYLTVESNREFENGKLIEQVRFRGERIGGKTYASPTGAKGLIKEIIKFVGKYNLDSSSIVENGFELNTGFLNDELQRVHDNNYYHAFSYAIKSKVQIKEWEDIVGSLNHTAGFKKFSDLQVESDKLSPSSNKLSNIDPTKSVVTTLVDLIGVESLNTIYDFDLATENYLQGVTKPFSDEINFSTRLITDYSESVSNRVVKIDDISNISFGL